jgi:hypothetical protein
VTMHDGPRPAERSRPARPQRENAGQRLLESAHARPSLPASLGITSRETGLARAIEARIRLVRFASKSLSAPFDFDVAKMTLMSALTRAQAFHDGTVGALRADNPYAAFTLLRSYAENAAMMVWLRDHPGDIERFYPGTPRQLRLKVGRLTNNASSRLGGFKEVYEQLSGFAHPAASSALSGWHGTDEDMGVMWASVPSFKNDDDFMMACVWLVELAQANAHLWRENWEAYFGDPPMFVAPPWKSGTRDM